MTQTVDYTKVNSMKAEVNRISALIEMVEERIQYENEILLKEAIMNLIDGVGSGYHSSDYYATSRYYISQNGLKNIRLSEDGKKIYVKIVSPMGLNIPEKIKVRGIEYDLEIWYSKNFDDTLNY